MKVMLKVVLPCLMIALTACSTNFMNRYASNSSAPGANTLGAGTTPGVPVGGSFASAMDSLDHSKLSHALDKSPGTSTTWTNASTGTQYTVTPLAKTSVNGNSLCRRYQVTAVRGGNRQETQGTACVASDGAWSEV